MNEPSICPLTQMQYGFIYTSGPTMEHEQRFTELERFTEFSDWPESLSTNGHICCKELVAVLVTVINTQLQYSGQLHGYQ